MNAGVFVNCACYEKHIPSLQEEFLKNIHPKLEGMGYVDIEAIFPHSDWKNRPINYDDPLRSQDQREVRSKLKKNNKGFIVKEGIARFNEGDRDVMLHIDGSKKFQLNSLIEIATPLLNSSVDLVLTVRDISGISLFRRLIESFEKFILEKNLIKKYMMVKVVVGG